jgi:hypothetical protein
MNYSSESPSCAMSRDHFTRIPLRAGTLSTIRVWRKGVNFPCLELFADSSGILSYAYDSFEPFGSIKPINEHLMKSHLNWIYYEQNKIE